MDVPTSAQQDTRRKVAAGLAVTCIFGLIAAYQPTPIADRSGEPLSATAAILARREGERAGVGAAERRERAADRLEIMERLATERTEQTAYRGRKREQWRREYIDGYFHGYLRQDAIQSARREEPRK